MILFVFEMDAKNPTCGGSRDLIFTQQSYVGDDQNKTAICQPVCPSVCLFLCLRHLVLPLHPSLWNNPACGLSCLIFRGSEFTLLFLIGLFTEQEVYLSASVLYDFGPQEGAAHQSRVYCTMELDTTKGSPGGVIYALPQIIHKPAKQVSCGSCLTLGTFQACSPPVCYIVFCTKPDGCLASKRPMVKSETIITSLEMHTLTLRFGEDL